MAGDPDHIDRQAQAFFDAFVSGNLEAASRCLTENFRAWHNTDNVWQTRLEHLATLAWLNKSIQQLRYEEVVRNIFPGGFVQRHVLKGVANGTPVELRACIVGEFDDAGKIVSTMEYLDSQSLRPLYAKAGQ